MAAIAIAVRRLQSVTAQYTESSVYEIVCVTGQAKMSQQQVLITWCLQKVGEDVFMCCNFNQQAGTACSHSRVRDENGQPLGKVTGICGGGNADQLRVCYILIQATLLVHIYMFILKAN